MAAGQNHFIFLSEIQLCFRNPKDKVLTKAKNSLQDREAKIRAVYEKIEDQMELVGAIGVEDKLQDGVKDTLVALGQAGIKVCFCLFLFVFN